MILLRKEIVFDIFYKSILSIANIVLLKNISIWI